MDFMKECILATDMAEHFSYIGKLGSETHGHENNRHTLKFSVNDRRLLGCAIIKYADISNISRPFSIYTKWVNALYEEYKNQTEAESMCRFSENQLSFESTTPRSGLQISFMNTFAIPFFEILSKIFPNICCILENSLNNLRYWEEHATSRES